MLAYDLTGFDIYVGIMLLAILLILLAGRPWSR